MLRPSGNHVVVGGDSSVSETKVLNLDPNCKLELGG